MYKITKEKFGYFLTFGGNIDLVEMNRWREECKAALIGAPKTFGVLIDMRTLRPGAVAPDAQAVMVEGQGLFKKAGMERSCVILESAVVTMQFVRLARQSGIYSFERYINAASHPDWHKKALGWIENKIDPGD
ncbi:MAG: hypothetical protein ABSC76_13955 [Terracidiphilus sp.]|jgi:hypothetical protein